MLAECKRDLQEAGQALQREIDHRARAEEALRESEAKCRPLVDHSCDLIWSVSAEGVFTYASPSWKRVLGHEPSSLIGKPFHPYIHPDDLALGVEYLRKVVQTRGIIPVGPEYRVRHARGDWQWHIANGTPAPGCSGRVCRRPGVSRLRRPSDERVSGKKGLESLRSRCIFFTRRLNCREEVFA